MSAVVLSLGKFPGGARWAAAGWNFVQPICPLMFVSLLPGRWQLHRRCNVGQVVLFCRYVAPKERPGNCK